jgi:hypothetical protein
MMRWLIGSVVLFVCVYVASAPLIDDVRGKSLSALSVFSGINPKVAESVILEHYALLRQVLRSEIETSPHTLTTIVDHINEDGIEDIVATLESEATCGSGGCLATIYLQNELHEFEPIDFNYTVKNIELLDTYTNGMRDLRINDDKTHHLVWDGVRYVLEETNEASRLDR